MIAKKRVISRTKAFRKMKAAKTKRVSTAKAVRKSSLKKPLGASVGSIAPNLHEGSRSEYLAQYIFSAFGTAVPVPHQEDTGLDIYCTLLERVGRRAWPLAYYSVQVKSTMDRWIFDGAESVRWLIEHPLPIFLCVVNKAEARLLIYHTTPRFAAWILPIHKNRLELIPGTETKAQTIDTSWAEGSSFELKAPILNFTIQDALKESFSARIKDVLKWWIDFDMENIFRIRCGNHHFRVPHEYETNRTDVNGATSELGGPFSDQSVERAKAVVTELLGRLAMHLRKKDELVSAAIYATALRRLAPRYVPFDPHDHFLQTTLNYRFGMNPPTYAYQAVDSLKQMLIDKLAEHGITDTEGEQQTGDANA
jgi:hypothetical protein